MSRNTFQSDSSLSVMFSGRFMGKEIRFDTKHNIMKVKHHKLISVVKGSAVLATDEDCWYEKTTSDKKQLYGLCGRRSPRGVTSILYLNIYHIILYHF